MSDIEGPRAIEALVADAVANGVWLLHVTLTATTAGIGASSNTDYSAVTVPLGDVLRGGAGADLLAGGWRPEIILGGWSGDTLLGFGGGDFLVGAGGDDRLFGGTSRDFLYGGDEDDLLHGGSGLNYLYAGNGDDVLDVRWATAASVDAPAGIDFSTYRASKRVYGAEEYLFGDDGNDRIFGSFGKQYLIGGPGDDWAEGMDGDDQFYGDEGNDTLIGGAGNDQMESGDGDDRIDGGLGRDAIVGQAGRDVIEGGNGDDLLIGDDPYQPYRGGNDTIHGGCGRDVIYGNPGADLVDGGGDDDWVRLGTGNDIFLAADDFGRGNDAVWGEAGRDRMHGGRGDDALYGGTGDDTLTGGAGNDSLYGGDGADTFVFWSAGGVDAVHDLEGADRLLIAAALNGRTLADPHDLAIRQDGEDAVIDLGAGSELRLVGVSAGEMAGILDGQVTLI